MSQNETLALVATAVDKASGPLREIADALAKLKKEGDLSVHGKSLAGFSKELDKLGRITGDLPRHGKNVESYALQWKEFGRRASDAASDIGKEFIPALGKLNFGTIGAAAGIGLLTAAVKKFGEEQHEAFEFSKRSGFDAKQVDTVTAAFTRLGVSQEESQATMAKWAEQFRLLGKPSGGPIGERLRMSGMGPEADRMMAIERSRIPIQEKNNLLMREQIGIARTLKAQNPTDNESRLRVRLEERNLPGMLANIVRLSEAEVDKLLATVAKARRFDLVDEHKIDEAVAAWAKLNDAFVGVQRSVLSNLLPGLTSANEALAAFVGANTGEITLGITGAFKGLYDTIMLVKPVVEAIDSWLPKGLSEKLQKPQSDAAQKPIWSPEYNAEVDKRTNEKHQWWRKKFGLDPEGAPGQQPAVPAVPAIPADQLKRDSRGRVLPDQNTPLRFSGGDDSLGDQVGAILGDPPTEKNTDATEGNTEQLKKLNELLRRGDIRNPDGSFRTPTAAERDQFLSNSTESGNVQDLRGQSEASKPGGTAADFGANPLAPGSSGRTVVPPTSAGTVDWPTPPAAGSGSGAIPSRSGGGLGGMEFVVPGSVDGAGSRAAGKGAGFGGRQGFGSTGDTNPNTGEPLPGNGDNAMDGESRNDRALPTGASGRAIDRALKLEGSHEVKNRELISRYLKTGGRGMDPKQSAWCAAFVNSSLQQEGVKGTGSDVATSFGNYGSAVKPGDVQKGDVLVQMRGHSVGETGGHVGMATGNVDPKTGKIEMFAGNQSDMAKRTWQDPRGLTIRRPPEQTREAMAPFDPGADVQATTRQAAYPAAKFKPPAHAGQSSALFGAGESGSVPGGEIAANTGGGLAEARQQAFAEELKNPAVRDKFIAYSGAEHEGAPGSFMESVGNRALANKTTLAQQLNSKRYFPDTTRARVAGGIDDVQRAQGQKQIDDFMAGANTTNYATGNASGPESAFKGKGYFGRGDGVGQTAIIGGTDPKHPERYGIEAGTEDWAKRMSEGNAYAFVSGNKGVGHLQGSQAFSQSQLQAARQSQIVIPDRDPDDDHGAGMGKASGKGIGQDYNSQADYLARPAGELSAANEMTHKVEGSGSIDVNVNAPRGTTVKAGSSGMFKQVDVRRTAPMTQSPESNGPGGAEE